MRISDWSSDVCSSDLHRYKRLAVRILAQRRCILRRHSHRRRPFLRQRGVVDDQPCLVTADQRIGLAPQGRLQRRAVRSEEPTSELQSLMRISYAVFCLKKKKTKLTPHHNI